MKKIYSYFLAIVILASYSGKTIAQMVGDNIFLQGHWVEAGVAPNGSLGSTRGTPSGYHPYMGGSGSYYDPALGAYATVSTALMMVYDADHDGWTSGTPPYFGDYSLPGTPYEGWGIQVNGSHSEAQFQYYTGTAISGFAGGATLTGTNISYTNVGGALTALWRGTAMSGQLAITQTAVLDTNASWVKIQVVLKNTGGTTLTNVYYDRETDPDNDVARGGSFNTRNVIDYQKEWKIHQ